jgi:hypothetical protein
LIETDGTNVQSPKARDRLVRIRRLFTLCAVAGVVTFSVLPGIALVVGHPHFQFDFHGDLYNAGRAITSGTNPYQMKVLEAEAAAVRAGRNFKAYASPRWPPPVLLAAVPLSLLPFPVAGSLFMLLSVGGLILALRLLGVRDWRCLAVASLSWPVVWGAWLGNVSMLLVLGAAVAWRWRASLWTVAVAIASVIGAKLFMWPLLGWLLVTRRFRTLGLTVLLTVGGIFAAWAVIGFAGLATYPHMLALVTYIGEGRGSSLVACLLSLGVPVLAARAITLACAAGLLELARRLARLPDGDRRAFGVAVMASLIATPVVWAHYFVLLFIPIALICPQLSAMWFLPMLTGAVPTPPGHPTLWAPLPYLALELVVIIAVCSPLLTRLLVRRPATARLLRTSAIAVETQT